MQFLRVGMQSQQNSAVSGRVSLDVTPQRGHLAISVILRWRRLRSEVAAGHALFGDRSSHHSVCILSFLSLYRVYQASSSPDYRVLPPMPSVYSSSLPTMLFTLCVASAAPLTTAVAYSLTRLSIELVASCNLP